MSFRAPPAPPEPGQRRWLPVLGVLLLMLGPIAVGAYAAEAVADLPSPPVEVDGVVAVAPPPGWEFVGRSDDGTTVAITRGDANLIVFVPPAGTGSAEQALRALVDAEVAASDGLLIAERPEPFEVAPGRAGLRVVLRGRVEGFAYPVEGEVVALTAPSGRAVLFVGLAPAGDYHLVASVIRRMMAEAVLR